jgi:hypothetical protein
LLAEHRDPESDVAGGTPQAALADADALELGDTGFHGFVSCR